MVLTTIGWFSLDFTGFVTGTCVCTLSLVLRLSLSRLEIGREQKEKEREGLAQTGAVQHSIATHTKRQVTMLHSSCLVHPLSHRSLSPSL